ncbi:hypothetical protein G9A89_007831 [Geosiphon pyriformis]|nr:hypothetical protein G9A89_007831 [Geosiphon pyriformis]
MSNSWKRVDIYYNITTQRTEDLNSETLATYFQELNFNIIEYCEENYLVQFQYSIDFESETETSNKNKQKVKQYSKTTPNTPILLKTTAKYLQTPKQKTSVKLPLSITPFPILLSPKNSVQQQEPISTSANIIDYLQKNESNHLESLENEETELKQEETTENKEEMATAYIAKIPEFTDQFIAGLKDKFIKKVHSHSLEDLATAIRHAKNYEITMEEANYTKLVNLAIGETSLVAEKKIDQLTKKNNNNRINPNNQLVLRNSGQQRPNHFHIQSSYLTMTEELNYQQTALSEDKAAAPRTNPSNYTILPAQIAQNANFLDIFPFEFEANESPFLLSNAAVNEQKAITAMYTEAEVEGKPICLILDSRSAGSIITYQLMQQLKRNVDRPAQTVIVTADEQYTIVPATYGTFNKCSEKALVFEEKEMAITETYMALGSTSNWAEETEQEIFKETREWKKVRYSTPEPRKKPLYIPLKCKDYKKKLSFMRACISSEEEYETHTCYFYKACHKERFGSPKRSGK